MEDEMKRELNGVKQAVTDLAKTMHSEFGRVHAEFAKVHREIADIKGVTRRTAIQVARLVGDVAEIEHTIAFKMVTKDDTRRLH